MRRAVRLAVVLHLAIACASGAARAAEQQDFRCPAPGTVIEYTGGARLTFGAQDGLWCTGKDVQNKPWRWYAALAGQGARWMDGHPERLWPLEVGKEIDFKYQADSHNVTVDTPGVAIPWYVVTIKVLRREPVSVKAGTFDAWVIETHEEVSGKFVGAFVSTLWWAPQPGYLVKRTSRVIQGVGKDFDYEATRVIAPSPATATVRPSDTAPPVAAPVTPAHQAPPLPRSPWQTDYAR